MEAEQLLMEQQLQETAGELQEAERVLDVRELAHQASLQRRKSLVKTVVADVAEHGAEVPAIMRPGSAPLKKEGQSAGIVMPSGGLVSFDSIRRDLGSMMQVGIYAQILSVIHSALVVSWNAILGLLTNRLHILRAL